MGGSPAQRQRRQRREQAQGGVPGRSRALRERGGWSECGSQTAGRCEQTWEEYRQDASPCPAATCGSTRPLKAQTTRVGLLGTLPKAASPLVSVSLSFPPAEREVSGLPTRERGMNQLPGLPPTEHAFPTSPSLSIAVTRIIYVSQSDVLSSIIRRSSSPSPLHTKPSGLKRNLKTRQDCPKGHAKHIF